MRRNSLLEAGLSPDSAANHIDIIILRGIGIVVSILPGTITIIGYVRYGAVCLLLIPVHYIAGYYYSGYSPCTRLYSGLVSAK